MGERVGMGVGRGRVSEPDGELVGHWCDGC